MNGNSKIVEHILTEADGKCEAILADAQERAEGIAAATESRIEAERERQKTQLEAAFRETVANKLANAALDARKNKLAAKQELIAACYDMAAERLRKLQGEEYKKFLANLLEKYAEEGEKVSLCRKDAGVVTQKFLDGFGKKLTLSADFHDGEGGVVLQGESYDKDLTFGALIEQIRAETETEVADILFGTKR